MNKKIVFLTSTRADFGKLKPLIDKTGKSDLFECHIFITGMHMLSKYGSTILEVKRHNYKNIYPFNNQSDITDIDVVLSNTIIGFSNYIKELNPDLIIVHGDRVEALAAAIVGALNNILVAHIEGGEISGTIDEVIRHAITKLSHLHFVANDNAKKRVVQLGEKEDTVFVIGSPDIDIMSSRNLPDLKSIKEHYQITFKNYAIFCYHPVTTELEKLKEYIKIAISSLLKSNKKYIVIYPNNDPGSNIILEEIISLKENKNLRIFPSIRFESYLTLLKNAEFIIGNSSAGIREAGFYAVPAINIGNRQYHRSKNKEIITVEHDEKEIIKAINNIKNKKITKTEEFGDGKSAERFFKLLKLPKIWQVSRQKYFVDYLPIQT